MDSDRFDELSKQLARPRSRREALGLLGAAVAGLITGRSASAAPKADKPSKCYGGNSSCTNAKQCCSGICTNRRCAPEILPECTVATDCTDPITECQVHTCTAGVCGVENAVAGTGCSTGVCNGSGQCLECLTGTDCASGVCENNTCTPVVTPDCTVAADCPGTDTECQVRTCTAGVCGTDNAASGSACADGFCNGSGQCVECLYDNDCATNICRNGVCAPCADEYLIGQPCTVGMGACLRSGAYVCAPDGLSVVCDAQPGSGSPEICNGIDDDCDGEIDEDVICPQPPNTFSACVDGNCVVQSCAPGFGNCNGNQADGCETNLMTSTANCGTCGRQCPAGPNSTSICTQGNCQLICFPDFKNCNNMVPGCECPPTGECRGTVCCISSGAQAHPTIPCCSGVTNPITNTCF